MRCRKPKQQSPLRALVATFCAHFQFFTSPGPFFKGEGWRLPLRNTKGRTSPDRYIQVIKAVKKKSRTIVKKKRKAGYSKTGTWVWPILPRNSVSSESKPNWVRNQLQNIFAPTDNKLAMKLFGSKKALMKERVRQKEIGHWIIHPCSSFRCPSVNHSLPWNLIIVIQLTLLGWELTPFVW